MQVSQSKNTLFVRRLVESAVMVALAVVLSLIKLAELPYGGSVTCASMLPILIVAYRNGPLWGLGSGLVFSVVQLLTGLSVFSWVTGWRSVIAVALLDYILAFLVSGLGGIFRKEGRSQETALIFGALLVSGLRFVFHFLSGVTVWRDISIPGGAAVIYSIVYNATYMIPETIVLLIATLYIGSILDFSYDIPRRFPSEAVRKTSHSVLSFAIRLVTVGALMFDVAAIAAHLQDAETGKFTFSHLGEVAWSTVSVVSIVALLLCAVYFLFIDGILREKRYVVRVAEEEARIAEEAAKIAEEANKQDPT
ncbi:MAG: energy-coupled thiamine transporter ThiT [Clostridia bacterium]|nr:energy-coupled thiamine transporter ThiT [Clostridia bacterium]